MLGNIGEKKNQLLQLIQKIVVGQSFCSIGCVEYHGSKPRTSSSSSPHYRVDRANSDSRTANFLKDADERIVRYAIWTVQHGCQRLVVMLNDTDTVMRLLHFTHTLVRDNQKKIYVEWASIAIVIAQVQEYLFQGWAGARSKP